MGDGPKGCSERNAESWRHAETISGRRYRYDMYGADRAGVSGHPQVVILRFAPGANEFDPKPIGDCWDFTSAPIANPPSFIKETTWDQPSLRRCRPWLFGDNE